MGVIKQIASSVNGGYFQWLAAKVNMDDPRESYLFLASALFKKPFESHVDFDINRMSDGLRLRSEYEQEFFYQLIDKEAFEVSTLEVLIALAERMEVETDKPMVFWFWELLSNLELHHYTDKGYYNMGGPNEINYILNRWIKRNFSMNGEWSVFPLKHTNKDQRYVELWYQMQSYLKENCDF